MGTVRRKKFWLRGDRRHRRPWKTEPDPGEGGTTDYQGIYATAGAAVATLSLFLGKAVAAVAAPVASMARYIEAARTLPATAAPSANIVTEKIPEGAPTPVFEQDFSNYTSTQHMKTSGDFMDVGAKGPNNAFWNHQQIELDETVGYGSLTQSMKYTWPDTEGWADGYDIDGPGTSGPDGKDFEIATWQSLPWRDEFWVEVWLRYSDNFKVWGPATGAADHKTLFLHPNSGAPGRWSIKFGPCCANTALGDWPRVLATVPKGSDEGPWDPGFGDHKYICFNTSQVPAEPTGRIYDGEWTGIRFHGGAESAGPPWELWLNNPNMTSGWEQVWSTTNETTQDNGVTRVERIKYGANVNQGSYGGISMWWGRVRMWDEDPGW